MQLVFMPCIAGVEIVYEISLSLPPTHTISKSFVKTAHDFYIVFNLILASLNAKLRFFIKETVSRVLSTHKPFFKFRRY